MPLTDMKIRGLAKPSKATKVYDRDGLYLLSKPNGSRLFRYDCTLRGKRLTLSFGKWPTVNLAQARRMRDAAREALELGRDPRTVNLASGDDTQVSLREVAEDWYAKREGDWSELHRRRVRRVLDRDLLPDLGERDVGNITPVEVLECLRKMEARGVRDLAHAARGYLGKIFRVAVAEGLAERDPSADIRDALAPKPKAQHRKRLSAQELPGFLAELHQDERVEERTRDAMMLTILTAARTSETRFAHRSEFEDLDGERPLWRLSAERMKMDREHLVPLSRQAVAIVKRRLERIGPGDLLFGADTRSGSISENTMLFELYRLGYRGRATVHGFRGTFSTIANDNEDPNWDSDWVELALAHVQGGVRAAYNSAKYLTQRRRLLQWWGDYVEAALKDGLRKT